jgi:GPI ethanolamine phosphate transferase 1
VCYLLGALWPLSYGRTFVEKNKYLVATWGLACGVMSSFTLLPAVKVESIGLMYVSHLFPISGQYLFWDDCCQRSVALSKGVV